MKTLTFAAALIPALAFAGTNYELDQKKITVENIGNDTTISVIRTQFTPNVVHLKVPMDTYRPVCEQWGSRQVWVEGHWTKRCFSYGNKSSKYGGCMDMRDQYIDAHYKTEAYCTQSGLVKTTDTSTVVLNFRNASKLSQGDQEVFTLNFDRESSASNRFEVRANTEESETSYMFKKTGFFRPLIGKGFGLKFIAK